MDTWHILWIIGTLGHTHMTYGTTFGSLEYLDMAHPLDHWNIWTYTWNIWTHTWTHGTSFGLLEHFDIHMEYLDIHMDSWNILWITVIFGHTHGHSYTHMLIQSFGSLEYLDIHTWMHGLSFGSLEHLDTYTWIHGTSFGFWDTWTLLIGRPLIIDRP
jgi:hypothetical protein